MSAPRRETLALLAVVALILAAGLTIGIITDIGGHERRLDDLDSRLDELEQPVVRSQASEPAVTTTTRSVPSVRLCAGGHVAETGPLEAANAPNAKRAKGAGC